MTIVAGTDFSSRSIEALIVAAQLARAAREKLHIVHAYSADLEEPSEGSPSFGATKSRLDALANRFRATGIDVQARIAVTPPDEALLEAAMNVAGDLVVVGALGNRTPGRWRLGSHAHRLALQSHIPVLVIRDAAPFTAWLSGEKPLRILLGIDFGLVSQHAARWIAALERFGPCDILGAHLYWPPDQMHRLGIAGPRDFLSHDPVIDEAIERELRRTFSPILGKSLAAIEVEPNMGNTGDRLAQLATQQRADLVVVGSRVRPPLQRLWEGSASHRVLHQAEASVACIPTPEVAVVQPSPHVRTALAATDFSRAGDDAAAYAYSLVERGGTVHLLHVATKSEIDADEHLRRLVPIDAAQRGIRTCVHVIESTDVPGTVCQSGERFEADVVCLATRAAGPVKTALFGSVAQEVVRNSKRPILLCHPRAE